jgi:hypothetical protein
MQLFSNLTSETFTNFSKIVGPFVDNGFADESTLDIEYIMGVASKVPNTYVTVADGWVRRDAFPVRVDTCSELVCVCVCVCVFVFVFVYRFWRWRS